jgi:hypothetical protein
VKPQLYIRAYVNELDVVDWFIIVGQMLWGLAFAMSWTQNAAVAASGWGWAAYNYYTARRRFHPELHS